MGTDRVGNVHSAMFAESDTGKRCLAGLHVSVSNSRECACATAREKSELGNIAIRTFRWTSFGNVWSTRWQKRCRVIASVTLVKDAWTGGDVPAGWKRTSLAPACGERETA